MSEYIPFFPECAVCQSAAVCRRPAPTPKESILMIVLLLSHDIAKDRDRQGFWIEYNEDDGEMCPICDKDIAGEMVIEASCLHRFHYDCILHTIHAHDLKFCPSCEMRIF